MEHYLKSSAKLNIKEVKEIRKSKQTRKELATKYYVSIYAIKDVQNYYTWKNI